MLPNHHHQLLQTRVLPFLHLLLVLTSSQVPNGISKGGSSAQEVPYQLRILELTATSVQELSLGS